MESLNVTSLKRIARILIKLRLIGKLCSVLFVFVDGTMVLRTDDLRAIVIAYLQSFEHLNL